jgi:hypothetical protein
MDLAALIISTLSLFISIICIAIMLAKNFFSTHNVQLVPVDPFKDQLPGEIGKPKFDQFQDLEFPMDQEEIDELKGKKTKF